MKEINRKIAVCLILFGMMGSVVQAGDIDGDGIFDTVIDTDGDGIGDIIDIDDDNDGILDGVEIQGAGNCPSGFYHIIDGTLNVLDSENQVYLPIGEKHSQIHTMGFDEKSAKLYAVIGENTTDDFGTALQVNEIIEIDRYDGKIKKASSHIMNSLTGDFYDGKLYGFNYDTNGYSIWDSNDDTLTDIATPDSQFRARDYAISKTSGTLMAYGLKTVHIGKNKVKLFRFDLDNTSQSSVTFFVTTPDGLALDTGWGAVFFADDNTSSKLYAANNNGYIYEIQNFVSGTPIAVIAYRTVGTVNNDGASCRNANEVAVDSDNDGYTDYLDLDSDNDAIPDNVEAQSTTGYIVPANTWADADADGLADQYDNNDSGLANSNGLIPIDTDGDKSVDFIDSDSDNDGYTDCEEGNSAITASTDCPITAASTSVAGGDINGMIGWAEGTDGDVYWNGTTAVPNGIVSNPLSGLYNETGDTSEIGYREFLCGKNMTILTHLEWTMISFPCNTGNEEIQNLFNDSLGIYGDFWVMYEQSGTDNYEIDTTYTDTTKRLLEANDKVIPGQGYWINVYIANTGDEVNVTIDKDLPDLSPTTTVDVSSTTIGYDSNFTQVHEYTVPNNIMINNGTNKEYIAGNPFPYAFDISDLYFKHNDGSASYLEIGNVANDGFIVPIIYKYNSANESYTAISVSTPGFSGRIEPMEGFFIKLEDNNTDNNTNNFAYPLMNVKRGE